MVEMNKNRRYSAHYQLNERRNAAAIRRLGGDRPGGLASSSPTAIGHQTRLFPPGRDLARRSLEIHPAESFGRDA